MADGGQRSPSYAALPPSPRASPRPRDRLLAGKVAGYIDFTIRREHGHMLMLLTARCSASRSTPVPAGC